MAVENIAKTTRDSLRPSERAEFADIDYLLSPSELTKRHREEQQQYISELEETLEAERRLFENRLRQENAAHAERLVDILCRAAFNEANGGMDARDQSRLAIVGRTVTAVPVDIERSLDSARRKAEKAGKGQTPVMLMAEVGPISGRSDFADRRTTSPIRRVLLIADVTDVLPGND